MILEVALWLHKFLKSVVLTRDWLVKILEHSDSSQVSEFGLNKLDDEINDLQRRLMKPDTKIGFCHNDLQYGNIMLSEKDDSVTLIVCAPLSHLILESVEPQDFFVCRTWNTLV